MFYILDDIFGEEDDTIIISVAELNAITDKLICIKKLYENNTNPTTQCIINEFDVIINSINNLQKYNDKEIILYSLWIGLCTFIGSIYGIMGAFIGNIISVGVLWLYIK
jgi:hypothetical protein